MATTYRFLVDANLPARGRFFVFGGAADIWADLLFEDRRVYLFEKKGVCW